MIQNCDAYMDLTPLERAMFIGELLHVCQSDDDLFYKAKVIIDEGKQMGLLDGVKIIPERSDFSAAYIHQQD